MGRVATTRCQRASLGALSNRSIDHTCQPRSRTADQLDDVRRASPPQRTRRTEMKRRLRLMFVTLAIAVGLTAAADGVSAKANDDDTGNQTILVVNGETVSTTNATSCTGCVQSNDNVVSIDTSNGTATVTAGGRTIVIKIHIPKKPVIHKPKKRRHSSH
jgi:hypothetical protein